MALLLAAASGCDGDSPVQPRVEPAHVVVQHVLVGFGSTIPGRPLARTQAQADSMARSIHARAIGGENFDSLVVRYTDDQYPGIYKLANTGVAPAQDEYPRAGFVRGFGDAAFAMEVGQFARVDYDAQDSPYGYHILKRLE